MIRDVLVGGECAEHLVVHGGASEPRVSSGGPRGNETGVLYLHERFDIATPSNYQPLQWAEYGSAEARQSSTDRIETFSGHNRRSTTLHTPKAEVDQLQEASTADVEEGLPYRIYVGCVSLLRLICSQSVQSEPLSSDLKAEALRRQLGRLYLWGESMGNGQLKKALETADELKHNVTMILAAVGSTLVRRKFNFLPLLQLIIKDFTPGFDLVVSLNFVPN